MSAIRWITIKQDGAVVAQKQPGGVYNATIAWASDPLPEGQHLSTIEYNDQFAGLSSTTLTSTSATPRRGAERPALMLRHPRPLLNRHTPLLLASVRGAGAAARRRS